MHLNYILHMEALGVCKLDFIGVLMSSMGNKYIVVDVDYVSKGVGKIASPTNDAKVAKKLIQRVIFPLFRVPMVLISDGGLILLIKSLRTCSKNIRCTKN